MDFYSRPVDALLEKNIQSNVTLYHWDLPAALDVRGGWRNADFADYAQVMYRSLGDPVRMWTTLNEPWVAMDDGYLHDVHAPGQCALGAEWWLHRIPLSPIPTQGGGESA